MLAWYEDHLYSKEGLGWPALELFEGHWRCGEGPDQCAYAGPESCQAPTPDPIPASRQPIENQPEEAPAAP